MLNKRMLLTLIAVALLFTVAQSAYAAQQVNPEQSTVKWVGAKVTGEHYGNVKIKSGQVEMDGLTLKSARFVMDMNSITVTDLEPGKWNDKLTDHLKSEDFFGTDRYPEAIFELRSATRKKGSSAKQPLYSIEGDMTIKGITHAVTFEASVDLSGPQLRARGDMRIDRTKYGIKYRSGSVFDGLGDRTIYDEFLISFDVVTR